MTFLVDDVIRMGNVFLMSMIIMQKLLIIQSLFYTIRFILITGPIFYFLLLPLFFTVDLFQSHHETSTKGPSRQRHCHAAKWQFCQGNSKGTWDLNLFGN